MKKHDIEVKIQIDTREQDLDYVKNLIDSRISKDGVKLKEIEYICVKPNNCKVSTSDITIMYREKDSNEDWKHSKLAIELKKGNDIFQSLYTKASRERLFKEIDRCKEYDLQLYFIVTDSLTDLSQKIHKIPKFKITQAENTHFEQLILLQEKLKECGYNGVIVSGADLTWVVRRCIKHYVKKNKLQYW